MSPAIGFSSSSARRIQINDIFVAAVKPGALLYGACL